MLLWNYYTLFLQVFFNAVYVEHISQYLSPDPYKCFYKHYVVHTREYDGF